MEVATAPASNAFGAPDDARSVARAMAPPSRFGDKAFQWLTLAMAMVVVVLVILTGWQLWRGSSLAVEKFGFHFLATSTWDPVAEQFGALPFIYGTLVSSLIALLIAMPLSIATAVYLTELAPLWIRQPLVSLIEMLAAIPSVILGLWGIFVMVPWLRDYPFPLLKRLFGWTPFFSGPIYGTSMLAGGIIIAIMILPIITSVSREILRSVPDLQRAPCNDYEFRPSRQLSLAQGQEYAGFDDHLCFRLAGDRTAGVGLFSSPRQRRELSELGFFRASAEAGW